MGLYDQLGWHLMRTLSLYFGLRAYKPHYRPRTRGPSTFTSLSHMLSRYHLWLKQLWTECLVIPETSSRQTQTLLYSVLPTATFHNWLEFTTCIVHQSLLTIKYKYSVAKSQNNFQSPKIISHPAYFQCFTMKASRQTLNPTRIEMVLERSAAN